jgi:hypothetical protein
MCAGIVLHEEEIQMDGGIGGELTRAGLQVGLPRRLGAGGGAFRKISELYPHNPKFCTILPLSLAPLAMSGLPQDKGLN